MMNLQARKVITVQCLLKCAGRNLNLFTLMLKFLAVSTKLKKSPPVKEMAAAYERPDFVWLCLNGLHLM